MRVTWEQSALQTQHLCQDEARQLGPAARAHVCGAINELLLAAQFVTFPYTVEGVSPL